MHNSIILTLAALSASVLAAPHVGHRHKARDTTTTWTQGADVYIEDTDVVTVLVTGTPVIVTVTKPNAAATPAAKVQEKVAFPNNHLQINVPTPAVQAQPSPSPETTAAPAPSPVANSDSGSGTGTGPVPGPSNIDTTGSPTWNTSPNSMGKSILGTANYWRKTWDSSLGAFEWDETLANNARSTAVDPIVQGANGLQNEGGANQMNHMLHQGSTAQCINEGDGVTVDSGLTPFEQAFLGWLCERPNNNIPCDKIAETGHYGGETGHADIISGGYSKIGCYYQDGTDHPSFVGMWTCDFA